MPQSDVPGEKTSPTQPLPTKPPRVRAQLPQGARRCDRFHAGAACAGARSAEAIQGRPARSTRRSSATSTGSSARSSGQRGRRHELARSAVRSGNRTSSMRRPATRRRGAMSLVAPPPGFSDIRYVSGIAGRPFREVLGPGDCCAADGSGKPIAPTQPAPTHAARRAASRRRRRRRRPMRGLTVQGLPIMQAAVRRAVGDQSRSRRDLMWQVPHGDTPDNIRNHPALRGHEHPEDRPGRALGRRADGHEDARGHGRSAGDRRRPDIRAARCCARTTRQTGTRGRRGLDAGAAERLADDLHRSTASSTSSSRSAAAAIRANTSRSRCRTEASRLSSLRTTGERTVPGVRHGRHSSSARRLTRT